MRAVQGLLKGLSAVFLSTALIACQKNPTASTGLIGEGLMADREVVRATQEIYLIELSQDPLLMHSQMNGQGVIEPSAEHADAIQKEQTELEAKLTALSSEVRVIYRYKYVLNAIAVIAPTKIEESIEKLHGVKTVRLRQIFPRPTAGNKELQLAPRRSLGFNSVRTSVTHIEAQAAYDQGFRGQGMRIGVIDSGIDYTHSMLGGTGKVEDYKSVDVNAVSPHFPNAKVVGGIDLVGSEFNVASLNPDKWLPKPDPNPMDEGGHGTHVAGTIAGIGDGKNSYDGVAPEALLYAIKVFGNGSTTDEVVIAALEWSVDPNQDGVLNDKLHVVNLSLGGSNGTPYELYNKAVTQLSFSGTVVVAAAGNADNISFIVGSPSTAEEALSVAANIDNSDHNWIFKTVGFNSEGKSFALAEIIEGQTTKPIEDAGDIRGELVFVGLADKDFTEEEAAFIKGKVAMIDRGAVTFQEKLVRAEKAGAIGVIMVQNSDEPPFTMGGTDPVGIPGIMISKELGAKLKEQLDKAPIEVVFQNPDMIRKPELVNQVTDFSSRGPRAMDLLIKPEITAPGKNIISAEMGEGTKALQMSGTSMAAPHVAGVMALMKQKHPSLSSRDLKSILMSTAVPIVDAEGKVESVARQGAGQVLVSHALQAQYVSDPSSVSFGLQQIEKSKKISKTIRFKSLWDDELPLQVSLETSSPAISMDNASVKLAPMGTTDLRLTFTLKASAVAGLEEEVTGWIVLKGSAERTQKIPFLVRLQKVSNIKISKVEMGAESSLEMEGTDVKIELTNKSAHGGDAWLFNLIGQDPRKVVSSNPFISRECDLKTVGYRINGKDLEVVAKFFNRVTVWSLCEVSVMLDRNHDQNPEAELALTIQERIPGLTGTAVMTTLLDYPKAREIRKKAEEDSKIIIEDENGEPLPEKELDLKAAILAQNEAIASDLKSAVILKIPLEAVQSVAGTEPRIQVIASTQEARNSEMDDYLGDAKRWSRLSLVPQDQGWMGLQNLSLQGHEVKTHEAIKGAGRQALLAIFTGNSLDSRSLHDEQAQIYRPQFSEKEQELKPVMP